MWLNSEPKTLNFKILVQAETLNSYTEIII
jgi:hypothetical protein